VTFLGPEAEGACRTAQAGLCKALDTRSTHGLAGPSMANLAHAWQLEQLPEARAPTLCPQSLGLPRECHVLNILLVSCLTRHAPSAPPP